MTKDTDTVLITPTNQGVRLTRRKEGEEYGVDATKEHVFVLHEFRAVVLDMEDVHFHHDSAVLLPDYGAGDSEDEDRVTGLAAIIAVYRHAADKPQRKILIAGHADRSGPTAYNLELSRMRAQSVLHVLEGNREEWVKISHAKHKVRDVKRILKWVAQTFGWPCDPGEVNDIAETTTRAAVREFQETYNSEFGESIAVDGSVGRETWGAIFDVYEDGIMALLNIDRTELSGRRATLSFLDAERKTVGCGEHHPRTAEGTSKSAVDRRVEILFFDPGEEPVLDCHPNATTCKFDVCELYGDRRIYTFSPLDADPSPFAKANIVRIAALSRWFVPGVESCDIGYELEGPPARADKLALEVYASNYCELTDWNDGLPKFAPVLDTPLVKRTIEGANVGHNSSSSITDWKGEADCPKGILSVGADGKARVLTVACSPYTVLLRYYKVEADAAARIDLAPFWPGFDAAGSPVPSSLEVKYAIVGTEKLTIGRLLVWDRDGTVVFEKHLASADLTTGEHTFAWDGTTTDGPSIAPARMPYRVQIQGHERTDKVNGLALAVAHTEVRLYVHPSTLALDANPYVATNDPSSLGLGTADLYHADALPTRAADGRLWSKLMLAEAGFHPGPVNDAASNVAFNTALAEFQRSVPKHQSPPVAPFARLSISNTGADDEDARDALENLPSSRRRQWFGKHADKSDYDRAGNELLADLRDPAKTVVVWVDDRHWYTDPMWLQPPRDDVVPTIRSQVIGHRVAVGNMRGPYTWGDQRVTQDATDIARPWIPVQAEFRLLTKTQHLTDALTDTPSDAVIEATRAAIGPLRVDWSFDEIDGATISVPEVDRAQYNKERTRTRAALEWALNDLKTANYARKDVGRQSTYFNCPSDNGGIRPKTGTGYYKAAFGLGADALLPWKTGDDAAHETIVTVVHDCVGQSAAQLCRTRRVGRAGIYFHPSRMAGDGYRVRAQARFASHPDYDFANLAVLALRYPKPPQAHSAALRVWRKTSIRGYLSWGTTNSWPGPRSGMLAQYHACHVHIVNELGIADAEVARVLDDFWNTSQVATFRGVVKSCIAGAADPRRTDANIQRTANRIWPWHAHPNLGALNPVGPNPANQWNDVFGGIQTEVSTLWFKLTNRLAIELVDTLETKYGRMRGHLIVEFLTTPDFWSREYRCNSCGNRYHYCTKDGVTITHQNAPCPSACGGRLQTTGNTQGPNRPVQQYTQQLPVPSIGDPLGVSFNSAATSYLWTHELSHNRYYEHAGNAQSSGGSDVQHDHVNNLDPAVSVDAFSRPAPPNGDGTNAARQWDRCCTMTYVDQLQSYLAAKDVAFFCFKCVLKSRGWQLAGVNNPPSAVKEP